MPGLWQVKELVMEVIKIPQEHVDSCLFFRPGGEGGRLPGRCTVLSARRTAGREWGRRRTWSKARDRRGQMWEEWEWKDAGGTLEGGQKRVRERERLWYEWKNATNECWGFSELRSKTIRDGWVRTMAGVATEACTGAFRGAGQRYKHWIFSKCQIKSRESSVKHFC